jgi:hypothetical protein
MVFIGRPDFDRMTGQFFVAVITGIPLVTTPEFYGHHIPQ